MVLDKGACMAEKDSHSPPSRGSRSDTGADGGWHLKAAKLSVWSAIGVALITGALSAVTAYIAKPGTGQAAPAPALTSAPAATSAAPKASVRFDPVDRPVGICNHFTGTGEWDSETAKLLLLNRPWDDRTDSATGPYFLDGPAEKVTGPAWKGPRQEIGRDTEEGFAVEVSAVVVSADWGRFLSGVTSPSGMYWTADRLPPHAAVATMVVKRDGSAELEC
jgi:hypothetical protein